MNQNFLEEVASTRKIWGIEGKIEPLLRNGGLIMEWSARDPGYKRVLKEIKKQEAEKPVDFPAQ